MIKQLSTFLFASFFSASAFAQFCSGTIVKNTSTGTFTDGSGTSNYTDNSDCMWLIAPSGAGSITLSFTGVFDLELYNCSDKITVYDGADTTASIIAVLCGNSTLTPPIPITSTGGTMLVRFTSDFSYNNAGWSASYNTTVAPPVFCSGQNTLSAPSGSFSDGSGSSNSYSDNSNCSWLINPAGVASITVSFSAFDTEAGFDFVRIFDNNTSSQVAQYSGNSIPSSVTVASDAVLVQFTSNNSNTSAGWDASYTSTTTVGITESNSNNGISIYPNPMQNTATLFFENPLNSNSTFMVYDVYGKLVKTQEIPASASSVTLNRAELSNGMYFYSIGTTNRILKNGKLILE